MDKTQWINLKKDSNEWNDCLDDYLPYGIEDKVKAISIPCSIDRTSIETYMRTHNIKHTEFLYHGTHNADVIMEMGLNPTVGRPGRFTKKEGTYLAMNLQKSRSYGNQIFVVETAANWQEKLLHDNAKIERFSREDLDIGKTAIYSLSFKKDDVESNEYIVFDKDAMLLRAVFTF